MNQFETLRHDLHTKYGHGYTRADIDAKLDEVIAKHTAKAELVEFIPVLVEREVREFFGAHRIHVRFAAGNNHALAKAAADLTKKHAGEALYVDTAAAHPENDGNDHLAHVMSERGMGQAPKKYLEEVRTVAMPDYIVYLGREVERDEAGKDIKIWDIAPAETVEQARELADDLEARVYYMLNKLGIDPVTESVHV